MTEAQARAALHVPPDAARVLLFCESSHWDTNWLSTSEEYFSQRVEPILDAALAALAVDPRRVYCVESLYFLKAYWERHPERRREIRARMHGRQLRLLATSFTTPDTLLPHAESILRDFQLGHLWLREHGLPDSPGTAYFPDNFGHSPHLPSLMNAVGVTHVGITRVDGMYFVGCDWRLKRDYPTPQSTAALLEQTHQTHDFVWRDDSGAQVLCHWNARTYFLGDMLAHKGIIRWSGKTFGVSWRTSRHIARRIDGYVKELEPHARTPYLLCPIGMDFNDPIDRLPALLERYNREHYPRTGTFVALGGLDDYFALLEPYRAQLPQLQADPNPYWMGFLATRPEVKQRPTRIARTLLLAERVSATATPDAALEKQLHLGWSTLVLSNHHDYIPGTSPDRVWHEEQKPWLDAAEAAADRALTLAHRATAAPLSSAPKAALHLDARGDELKLEGPHYRLVLSKVDGGCITSLVTAEGELLRGFGFELIAFHDEGGLWRMGHEYAGGRFEPIERASQRPARLSVVHGEHGAVTFVVESHLGGHGFTRRLICRPDTAFLEVDVAGTAAERATVTCRFHTRLHPTTLSMDTVGGYIERPRARHFEPTFWGVPSRLTLNYGVRTLHALFESPSAAAVGAHGELDWVVARNAPKERAFGLLPVFAHPIGGTNQDVQHHRAALVCGGDVALAQRTLEQAWLPLGHRAAWHAAQSLVHCDRDDVAVSAVKRSHRRDGVTIRLFSKAPATAPVRLWVDGQRVRRAFTTDALERDLAPLSVDDEGAVHLILASRLCSVHLELEHSAGSADEGRATPNASRPP